MTKVIKILTHLERLHNEKPNQRFGQLLENFTPVDGSYYIKDDTFVKNLESAL